MFRGKNNLQMRFPFFGSSMQLAFDVGEEAFDGQAIAMDLCRPVHQSKGISHFLHLTGPKPLNTISILLKRFVSTCFLSMVPIHTQ